MIHLVYPHQDRISAPDVIGRVLADALSKRHEVRTHNLDGLYKIQPSAGDILIGHAHPLPFTVFRRSARLPGWSRRILMQPYNGDWRQVGFIDDVIDQCDTFLAITGKYWYDRVPSTLAARWAPKMIHLDLAVDRNDFPLIKTRITPRGNRRFLYIGNDHPGKNLSYLNAVASAWTNGEIFWAGRGRAYKHLKTLGYLDFSSPQGKAAIASFDCMITLGAADANPTTVLEAMSWGLIPVCTPTSGYVDEPGIVNVPLNDVDAVCQVLDDIQFAEDSKIVRLRTAGEHRIIQHFNWQRFTNQVEHAMSNRAPQATQEKKPARPVAYASWTFEMLLKVILKNLKYALQRQWPRFDLDHGVFGKLRNVLGK